MSARQLPRLLAVAFLGVALGHAEPSVAQPTRADVSQAAALFKRGKEMYDAGRHAEACTMLADSDRLDPAVGTLGLLAACHEQEGRLATAHREYLLTAERADRARDARAAYARERAANIKDDVPVLTVRSLGQEPGLEVTRGGEPMPVGERVLVDAGTHLIVARAPGRRAWSSEVKVGARESRGVVIPALDLEASVAAAQVGRPDPGVWAPPQERGADLRSLGLGVGAAGIAGAIVAGITGGIIVARSSEIDAQCPAKRCTAEGTSLIDGATPLLVINAVSWGVAIAGIGGGALLFLLGAPEPIAAPSTVSAALRPLVLQAGGGISAAGSF